MRRKVKVAPGHRVTLRPWESRYQLAQPPALQTVPSILSWSSVDVGAAGPRRAARWRRRRVADRMAQGVEDVGDLRLDHEDHARVAQPGVGADHEEQVGEPVHGRALVGLHAVLGKCSASRVPSRPVSFSAIGRSVVWKPVATMMHVDLALLAVLGDDAVRGDPGDAVGHQVDVVPVERGVPRVGDQDALAADRVVRRDLGPQLRVGDAALDVASAPAAGRASQLRVLGEAGDVHLAAPVDRRAVEPLEPGDAP